MHHSRSRPTPPSVKRASWLFLSAKMDDMTGIDISEKMVELAHEKDLYETLYVAELEDFLEDNDDEPFDLM